MASARYAKLAKEPQALNVKISPLIYGMSVVIYVKDVMYYLAHAQKPPTQKRAVVNMVVQGARLGVLMESV